MFNLGTNGKTHYTQIKEGGAEDGGGGGGGLGSSNDYSYTMEIDEPEDSIASQAPSSLKRTHSANGTSYCECFIYIHAYMDSQIHK
jgi:hypothetical protein